MCKMAYIIAITEVFDTFHCINKLVFMQGKIMTGDRNEQLHVLSIGL